MYGVSPVGNYVYIHFDRQDRDYVLAAVSRLQAQGLVCVLPQEGGSGNKLPERQASISSATAVLSFISPQAQLASGWRQELLQILDLGKELVVVTLGQVPVTPVLQELFSRLTVCPLLEDQREQWAAHMLSLAALRPALGQAQAVRILPWPAASTRDQQLEAKLVLRNLLTHELYPCLYPSFVLGRSQQKADYVFKQKTISREQLTLTYRKQTWWLTALSTNTPSFLNGSMAQVGKAYPLQEGDEISFAGERLRLEKSRSPLPAPLAPAPSPTPAPTPTTGPASTPSLAPPPGPAPTPLARSEPAAPGAAWLQVELSSDPQLSTGRKIPLLKLPFTLGRSASCDYQIKVRTVSSRHGEISRQGENYYFTDLGSTNGSRLNGQNLQAHKAYPLQANDLLQLHNESFHFRLN